MSTGMYLHSAGHQQHFIWKIILLPQLNLNQDTTTSALISLFKLMLKDKAADVIFLTIKLMPQADQNQQLISPMNKYFQP